jgi:excisionase family DNA binding protein
VPAPTRYMTAAEVADVLRVKPMTVANLCRTGELNAIRPLKSWLITQDDLDAYLEREAS